ncbi:transposase, partial [Tenacibaculum haliotis]|uniref:transposase n=1 Tax=Tenacibaculum haliotis TaxID=1888914 RepID=UPI0035E3EF6E|nr:hypothetical protein [Tenacibaculum haliotis]
KDNKSAIGTIVERKTRFTLILKLNSKKADEVADVFSKMLNQLNAKFKKSMTYDNGIEMENQLQIIQQKLNNRPRKIIGYKTPQEMINIELKNVA